jgi:esterase/lipase
MFKYLLSNLIKSILILFSIMLPLTTMADSGNAKIGIVVMHGKGGSPTKFVSDLASALAGKGYLVANLEMPWSGKRDYDVNVSAAENEVEVALADLRSKGAKKLFVAGHSQGGLFALYFGDKHLVDGIIAIAPGGSVASDMFIDKLGDYVAKARKMIAEGKGEEKSNFADFESARGTNVIVTTASVYFSWFDPAGAMKENDAIQHMNPAIPVLYVAPSNDYPGLKKIKQRMFDMLPKNPHTKMYEPSSDHLHSPAASVDEIVAWTSAIANQ